MPVPLPLLIGAGAQLLGGGIDALSTGHQNRQSQRFSREMYARQREDNILFWNMQNQYNSPEAQMKRLQAAGLNPNLVYGGSSGGTAGTAASISTPDVQTPQFRTSDFGRSVANTGFTAMNSMLDLEMKRAQIDNLKAQNTVIKEDALLKTANRILTGVNTDRGTFELGFRRQMKDISAEAMREDLRQTKTRTDIALDENSRRAALTASSLTEAVQRIANMKQQNLNLQADRARTITDTRRLRAEIDRIGESIVQMRKDGRLKDLDIALREEGVNPNDPVWMRILGRVVTDLFGEGDRSILSRFFGN